MDGMRDSMEASNCQVKVPEVWQNARVRILVGWIGLRRVSSREGEKGIGFGIVDVLVYGAREVRS